MLEDAYVIKAGYLMVYTGIPCFLKVRFTSLHFHKRPTLVPVLANWKEIRRGFSLFRKKEKIAFSICFAGAVIKAVPHPDQGEWHHQGLSPGTRLSISASSGHSFELLSPSICALSQFTLCMH